jgi:endonuclease G, mitochondrial
MTRQGPADNSATRFTKAAAEQERAAAERVQKRARERQEMIKHLNKPGGIAKAVSPERVARRLDRLTRYFAGENLPETQVELPEAPPADVVAAALDRTTQPDVVVKTPPAAAEAAAEATEKDDTSPTTAGVILEKIIGTSDFLDIRYLDGGTAASRPVCRIVIRNDAGRVIGYGSGSLVSPRLLLTNHHVLESAAVARRSSAEFNYQDGLDGKPLPVLSYGLDPDALYLTDTRTDFALVAVQGSAEELAQFGYNRLIEAEGKAVVGEFVTIIQHPGGEKKQIALRENQIVDIEGAFVHYEADTQPGSSGSPVFNDQWEVVGLHHASVETPPRQKELGAYINEGIRASRLLAAIQGQRLSGAQQELVGQLTGPERLAPIAAPARARMAGSVADGGRPVTTLQSAAVGEGDVARVTIPLEISVRIGQVTTPAPPSQPKPSMDPTFVVEKPMGPLGDEAIVIDPDYGDRRGYDPNFLGRGSKRVPLPALSPKLAGRAATNTKPKQGRPKYEFPYHHFSVVLNRERGLAFFTAVNIDGSLSYSGSRMPREDDKWFFDPRVPEDEQTGEGVYEKNDLDRGHLVRRLDPAWGRSKAEAKSANDDSFHFTNCTPQHKEFNERKTRWAGLEDYILGNADKENFKATVFTGPVLADDDDEYKGVKLPRQFWKVAVMLKDGLLSATAYLLSQENLIRGLELIPEAFSYGAYKTFQVPVKRIEQLTDVSFGDLVDRDPMSEREAAEPWREITSPDDLIL